MSRIKRFKPPKVATVIGQGTLITGDVAFSGGLHLDGSLTGNVTGGPPVVSIDVIAKKCQ